MLWQRKSSNLDMTNSLKYINEINDLKKKIQELSKLNDPNVSENEKDILVYHK